MNESQHLAVDIMLKEVLTKSYCDLKQVRNFNLILYQGMICGFDSSLWDFWIHVVSAVFIHVDISLEKTISQPIDFPAKLLLIFYTPHISAK